MSDSGPYDRRFESWLKRVGFNDDPFALYEAEREMQKVYEDTPVLSLFFVERPYLRRVIGDPAAPQVAFLLAGRGCGKTAARAMVAYEGRRGKLRHRALIVEYTDFDPLLDQVGRDLSRLEVQHHIRAVLRFMLQSIVQEPSFRDDIDRLNDKYRLMLMGYAQEFADPMTRLDISRVVGVAPAPIEWNELRPRECIAGLARIIASMGYKAVYILVDRVDELPETQGNPSAAANMLRPLVAHQTLLEVENLAFKFFLPVEVGDVLCRLVGLRRDRVVWETVEWDRKSLEEVLDRRLEHYSDGYTLLRDLFDTSAYRHIERLVDVAQSSPRNLLRLCSELLRYHIGNSPSKLISSDEVSYILARADHLLMV